MGINVHYYAYYGIKLEFTDKQTKTFEELSELFDEVTGVAEDASEMMLFDGYGGEYIIVGKMLFDSGDLRYNDIEDTFKSIPLDSLPQIETEYRAKFAKYFPEFKHLIDGKKFELMVFVHYS